MNTDRIHIPSNIIFKIFLSIFFIAVTIFILSSLLVHFATTDSREKFFRKKMDIISNVFTSSCKAAYKTTKKEKLSFELALKITEKLEPISSIRLWDKKGKIIFDPSEKEVIFNKPQLTENYFQISKQGKKVYANMVTILEMNNEHSYFLEILILIDDIEQITHDTIIETAFLTGLALLFFLPFFYFLIRRILAPIYQVSLAIKKIKTLPPSQWRQISQLKNSQYVNEIIISVNELIFRAQRSLICQENLGRFLAHEIKTPLTNLLNEIEFEKHSFGEQGIEKDHEPFYRQATQDIMRIRSIVNNICNLAYVNVDSHFEFKIDLFELLKSLNKEFEHIYKSSGRLENKIDREKAFVQMNPDYFWILFSNILRNSLEHGEGRHFPPLIRLLSNENHYLVEFSDRGPGFPFSKKILEMMSTEESLDQLLRSHGAGLVLCLKLAEIMNVQIKFENKISRGTVVTLFFKK